MSHTLLRQPPGSERAFVAGPTGSGKSHLLRVWAKAYPRQLVLDTTGEWASETAFAGRVEWAGDVTELGQVLQSVARQARWRVVIPTEKVEPEQLVGLLVPPHRPGRTSFPRAVGGIVLVVDEVAEIATHGQHTRTRPLWLRGRHHGLSILAASQRAADVGRMVTSQSERVAVTRTMEPLDLAYWRQFLRVEWFAALEQLEDRQAVAVNRAKHTAAVITTAGTIVRPLPYA